MTDFCYRTKIKDCIAKKADSEGSYSVARLAEETRIQRTFLSQVFQLKKHLSPDQIYLIAEALHLSEGEEKHFQELCEWEKCENSARKDILFQKLRGQSESKNQRVSGLIPEAWDDYVSDPHAELVYTFLQIDRYRKDPSLIRERLGLRTKRWEEVLTTLKACNLITEVKGQLIPDQHPYAIEDGSPEASLRHVNARLRVSEQKLKQRNIDDFLYNWWVIGTPEAKKELKIAYLNLIAKIYQDSQNVPAEDVYQLSIDLFNHVPK